MPSIYQPRRPRASPLWQIVTAAWDAFLADPLQCPCCKAPMKLAGAVKRPEQIEFFLRLYGLWEGIIDIPPPSRPPFDIEKRRGIGGVLDAGEAEARRVSPPGGAGESNLRAYRTTLAGNQGMDSRRRTGPHLVQPTPETIRTRPGMARPKPSRSVGVSPTIFGR